MRRFSTKYLILSFLTLSSCQSGDPISVKKVDWRIIDVEGESMTCLDRENVIRLRERMIKYRCEND